MVRCHRCGHQTDDFTIDPSGEERYRCINRTLCNQRRKWREMIKKEKKK